MNSFATRLTPAANTRRELWLALIAAALFSVESWALGPYSWMYGYGGGLETIPAHLALLNDHRLFSPWAPFIAGGVDRFAFWGNADPLNWEVVFLSLFPVWLANGLHRFAQFFIAIFFATKVCKEQLGLNSCQAMLGGVLYGCFSYFTFGEMLALPALPLFLCLMQRTRESTLGRWLPLVVGLGFSTITTFTHSVPYIAVFAGLWSAVVLRDTSVRAVVNLGLIVAGLTIGDLPQFLSALANASFSHRVGFTPETVDWSLDGLFYRQLRFDYFNQDPLAKVIAWDMPLPLLTAGALYVAFARFARRGSAALGATYLRIYAVYFLLSQRWLFVTAQNVFGEWLPPVRGIFMGRFFDLPASLLIACQLALLVALVHERSGQTKWPRQVVNAGVAALVAFMLIQPKLFLFYRIGVDGWGQQNYEVKALDNLIKTETAPFRVASVLPLQPGYAYAQGLETADGWVNLYPRVYREYWLRILAPLFRNVPATKNIFDPDVGKPQDHYIFLGADLMHPSMGALPGEDAVHALRDGFDVEQRFDLKLLGMLNVKYLLSEYPLKSNNIELVHAPADPPTVLFSRDWATGSLSPPSGPRGHGIRETLNNAWSDWRAAIQRRTRGKDLYIYKIADFLPRFRLVEEVRVEPSGRAVLDRLSSMDKAEIRLTAVIETANAGELKQRQNLAHGQITLINYKPDRIDLDATLVGDGFLVIANTWSPFWIATVDGRRQSLIRTNHAQFGLALDTGKHGIILTYCPPYYCMKVGILAIANGVKN